MARHALPLRTLLEAQSLREGLAEEAARAARAIVLDRLVQQELLLAEALARGYGDTPEARRALRAAETQRPDAIIRDPKAIEILQSLVQQHPEVPQYRFDLSETYAMIEGEIRDLVSAIRDTNS